ncbi:MAG: UbiD family decarboxylase [Steroidobacteraceae bacterium]
MGCTDLRSFIGHLERSGKLLRVGVEVDPRHEIAAYIRKTSDTGGPALYFQKVKGYRVPVVGGLYASRPLLLEAFGTDSAGAVAAFVRALGHLREPRRLDSGPCQEVVLEGPAADLLALPFPVYSCRDSGPFITSGVVISRDPEDGSRNASIYRLEVHGSRRLGVLAAPPHHLGIHIQKARTLGRPLEVAIAIGTAPAVMIATQWQAAYGVDELTLAGALLDEPLAVVRGRTVDLDVPASSEVVIEGRITPGVSEPEGPFGEYTGYYTEEYPKPVIEVSAITHRHDPIVQALLTGLPTTENHVLKMIPFEASLYALLKPRFPGVTAVHYPGAGGAGLFAAVAMHPGAPGEARAVLATILGTQQVKLAIVVDEDVDIFDLEKLMWAVCMHAQADRDLITIPNLTHWQLDPSVLDRKLGAGLGIDATRPWGTSFGDTVTIPGVEQVPDLDISRGAG